MLSITKERAIKSPALLNHEVEEQLDAILQEQIDRHASRLNSTMPAEELRIIVAKIEILKDLKGLRRTLNDAYNRST